ncbi:MAG: O-methyltransferase [Tenericutes bacterium]|nr:O-methyltransferase [Mycoplasmatota bacterium]
MDKLYKLIDEIRVYGENNSVPIMSRDTITTIQRIIKDNNIKSILEVGTAIGYSTICFASTGIDKIESIERDKERYDIAVSNVEKSGLNNISLNLMDVFDFNTDSKYDLIIIDAAKSQNRRIFEKFMNNLNENGIIIIDNLSFHGFVGKSNEIKSRNLRQMVRKIEKFIEYLKNNDEFDTEFIEVGDTLGVCKKKNL